MTLKEKLENSIILDKRCVSMKSLHILTKKQRTLSLVMFVFMCAYTIYSKCILKDNFLNISFLFVALNLITLCILKFISNSTFALNHHYTNSFIVFLNKVCKLVIFILAISGYVTFFNEYLGENEGINLNGFFNLIFKDTERVGDIFWTLFFKDVRLISCLVTIVLFIPNFIYFFILYIKFYLIGYILTMVIIIPIVNLILYIVWLSKNNNRFKYYYNAGDNANIVVERRIISKEGYKFFKFLKKFILTIPVFILIYGVYIYLIINSISTLS